MKLNIRKYSDLKKKMMSKKLILTLVLFIGLTAFSYESFKWTRKSCPKSIQKVSVKNNIYDKKNDMVKYSDQIKWSKKITDLPQEVRYEVRGKYKRPIIKVKLNEAKTISDFMEGYPVHWVTDYVSVEISANSGGKMTKAIGVNEVLTTEQKNILNNSILATDITINVKYKYKNPVTNAIENSNMYVLMTIVPEIEAEFIGGSLEITKYLKENVIYKITDAIPKQFNGIVIFTVNEYGEITNAKISNTSGDSKIDELLLEAAYKMPKWKPAEDSKGIKVKQDFEIIIGKGGGC